MVGRRSVIVGMGSTAMLALTAMRRGESDSRQLQTALARIERSSGGRLGVAIHDMEDGFRCAWRGGERFAMCSTFKLLLAAAILHGAQLGRLDLDQRLPIRADQIVPYSPITEGHVGGSLTALALCEAAVTISDNSAANLLIALLGGVEGVNAFARRLGDRTTRLDRIEPMLNDAIPGEVRDTTTPDAMLKTMQAILTGAPLGSVGRARLIGWMVASSTGLNRLRRGIPADWRAGDKTGTGGNGSTNDLAILWPPRRRPILIAAYLAESGATSDARNAVHQAVARTVVARTP
jgi:beta-lactamase class A